MITPTRTEANEAARRLANHPRSGLEIPLTRNSQDKLNAFHITGSIGIAAVASALCQSLPLFFIVAGALIGASLFTGEIRVPKRPGGKPRR